jgi:hypothetical protein
MNKSPYLCRQTNGKNILPFCDFIRKNNKFQAPRMALAATKVGVKNCT